MRLFYLNLIETRPRRVKLEKNMIKDRKYHLKSYKKSFVGKELVDWLVTNNEALDRQEALKVGRELLEAGVIHHGTKSLPCRCLLVCDVV